MEVLEREVGFYDAGGFDPGSEDVLLGGLVVGGPDPVQAVQVAGDGSTRGLWTRCGHCPPRAPAPTQAREGRHHPSRARRGAELRKRRSRPGLRRSEPLTQTKGFARSSSLTQTSQTFQ